MKMREITNIRYKKKKRVNFSLSFFEHDFHFYFGKCEKEIARMKVISFAILGVRITFISIFFVIINKMG